MTPPSRGSISCPQREASGKLVDAADEGDLQKVLALLALGADVDTQDGVRAAGV